MARPRQKNIVERLAGAGEEAIQRIGSAPGADRVVGALGSLKDRVDELQKSVRTIDKLEKRLDKLEGKGSSTSRKTSSAKRKTAARKPSSSS